MASSETRTRRFSRAEYERLIELGVFQPGVNRPHGFLDEDDPIELLDGPRRFTGAE